MSIISQPAWRTILKNLTGDVLTNEEESVLRFGLKHVLATRPKESDVIASAESIWLQLWKPTSKRIKVLKRLRDKYAILKPDKGNGTVLVKKDDYKNCMTELFADQYKFCKVAEDHTLTQLTTLQNYLRTIHNRGEITDDEYKTIRPQSTQPARAHGLPKTHKQFDNVPPFRPIVDTTGIAY